MTQATSIPTTGPWPVNKISRGGARHLCPGARCLPDLPSAEDLPGLDMFGGPLYRGSPKCQEAQRGEDRATPPHSVLPKPYSAAIGGLIYRSVITLLLSHALSLSQMNAGE